MGAWKNYTDLEKSLTLHELMETYGAVAKQEERQANHIGSVVVKAMWGDGSSEGSSPSKHNKYAGKQVKRVDLTPDLANDIGIGMKKAE